MNKQLTYDQLDTFDLLQSDGIPLDKLILDVLGKHIPEHLNVFSLQKGIHSGTETRPVIISLTIQKIANYFSVVIKHDNYHTANYIVTTRQELADIFNKWSIQ